VVLGKHPLPLVAQVAGQEKTHRVFRERLELQVRETAAAARLVVTMEVPAVQVQVAAEREAQGHQIVLLQ
jgi:uncharacterized protein YeaO (DUF488 family)